jgi:hypothetical protein
VFLREKFLSKENNERKVTLEEIQGPLPDASGQTEVEQVTGVDTKQVQQTPRVRRSERIVRAPERYLRLYEIFFVGDIDPLTYHEAMSREDSQEWLEAMKYELQYMKDNQV